MLDMKMCVTGCAAAGCDLVGGISIQIGPGQFQGREDVRAVGAMIAIQIELW